MLRLAAAAVLGLTALTAGSIAAAQSGAEELVAQARAHEAKQEDDLAVRRYTEALSLDPTCIPAWEGLGALRMKIGDPAEADRVFTAALARVPRFEAALEGRARARWAMGRHADAETDLEEFAEQRPSIATLRELARWFAVDGRSPAQLAVWRRILVLAEEAHDGGAVHEARRMVRALLVLVNGADPASSPPDPDATRRALAHVARRVDDGLSGGVDRP